MKLEINLHEIPVSAHFINDRKERKHRIDTILGDDWGNIENAYFGPYDKTWHILTDNGLIFIVSEDMQCIVTYFFATMEQAQVICKKSCSKRVAKKIEKNQRKYQKLYNEMIGKYTTC